MLSKTSQIFLPKQDVTEKEVVKCMLKQSATLWMNYSTLNSYRVCLSLSKTTAKVTEKCIKILAESDVNIISLHLFTRWQRKKNSSELQWMFSFFADICFKTLNSFNTRQLKTNLWLATRAKNSLVLAII